jgi:hypothetical protein
LFLILAGVFLFLSGNLDITNIQVHLGVTGFLSYIVPLFVVLCGALVWVSPSQRIFYGILGNAAAVYSIVSVNLGGFVVGMLLGIIGGSLAASWVPDKFVPAAQLHGEPPTDDFDAMLDAGEDTSDAGPIGAHALTEPTPTHDDGDHVPNATEGEQGTRPPRPRHADRPDYDEVEQAAMPRRSPRTVSFAVIVLIFSAMAVVTFHTSTPAAAADCAPASPSQLVKSATRHPANPKPKPSHTPATKPSGRAPATQGAGSVGQAAAAPRAPLAASEGPIQGLLGAIGTLLGGSSPSESPSDSPNPLPSASASAPKPPSAPPSASPPPRTSASLSKKPKPPKAPAPRPTTAPPCTVVPKTLTPATGQPDVQEQASTQTTALLTMIGLSYDGNVDLPTKGDPITVMQFSMDTSTSTPFQLDASVKGHTIRTGSSKLTVSGHVKFYATEIKGLLGIVPVDYTPDFPPLVLPPLVALTDVTIGLVFVTCDTLTANDLSITLPT